MARHNTDETKKIGAVIITAIIILVISFFSPVLVFASGWIAGWILKTFIGEVIANGLNTLFNVAYFTPEFLPVLCGILSVVGSLLRPVTNFKLKEQN